MVLVVERFEDFRKIVEKYAIRGYIVYDCKTLDSSIIYRISCGKIGTVVSIDKNNVELLKEIERWLKEIGAVKISGAIPIELFFTGGY